MINMTKLQALRSELEDVLELYDFAVSKIKELTLEIESYRVQQEGEHNA
jgi:hypothetical protein